ncbi:unnamed protein product [Rotaria sordida]|uniref:Uncharacterized protein n=1 Tax=Rotaria sordida TaxID=392033 RepID=A0A813QDB8_9BILA|nr:unnamed protein product [Rotaria sordida]CAF0834155.1 unnamed protein product [Rotaria sordida]
MKENYYHIYIYDTFYEVLITSGECCIPIVFFTNGDNKLHLSKVTKLSQVLISPEQIVMSYHPLKVYIKFHKKKYII